jgi:broad specificity phosphatase PhoE
VQTADAVARFHPEVPRYQLADLEEMSWGRYEGQGSSPELTAMFSAMQAEWDRGNYGRPFEGGESILDVRRRALRAIEYLLAEHEGEQVLVVTHGRYLRVLLATLLEDYGLARMQEIKHANTAVNHIVYRDGCYEAPLLNCTAHLERADALVID